MTKEEILNEIASLPLEAQRQIEDFIAALRERYKDLPAAQTAPLSDLRAEAFVGMWRDREDMSDSTAWVRNVREKHWGN
jgi:hypothetical protein